MIQPWYPGILQASLLDGDRAELLVGPGVGWVGSDTLLDRWDGFWLVDKRALAPLDDRPALPEERIRAARYPHLHKAARACRLVAVSKAQAELLELEVWHGEVRPTSRHLRLTRATEVLFDSEVDAEDVHGQQVLDRLLRQLSDGLLTEDGVLLALELATPARWAALEQVFSDLHGRAGTRASTARVWAESLRALEGDGPWVIDGLGVVQRESLEEMQLGAVSLPSHDRLELLGALTPMEWPEVELDAPVRSRSRVDAGRLALGLALAAGLLLALAVQQGVDHQGLYRLLAVMGLAGGWLSMRARA